MTVQCDKHNMPTDARVSHKSTYNQTPVETRKTLLRENSESSKSKPKT